MLILAHISAVRFLPNFALLILAHDSAEGSLPLLPFMALGFLPFNASLILARVSAECSLPVISLILKR